MKSLIHLFLCLIFLNSLALAHTFEVSYKMPETKPIYTPRVYIAMSEGFRSPRTRMGDWGNLPILFAVDDHDMDGKVTIDEKALSSMPMGDLEGRLKIQAIVRINPDWMLPGDGEGDLYSATQVIDFKKGENYQLALDASKEVGAPRFKKEGLIQDHYFKSEKLSAFHKRDYNMRYSVILPDGWDAADKNKKYPVIVYVTGFSAVHHKSTRRIKYLFGKKGREAIIVIPDANCRWGHSVFANSTVNGPWGDALTQELLPHIDKKYKGAGAKHRYITGVSSGGWTAAWAIVNYPEAYAGAWPVAPDPVDFEAFQELNLIDKKEDNLFNTIDHGKQVDRCISLPMLGWTFRNMAKFEHVLGPGGQLKSFAAVFSPKMNPDGSPLEWYDIETGNIDKAVTDAWKPYDIAHILQKNWQQLGPKLKGKMHFGIHENDMFHLDHAIRLLEKKCKQLSSDATFVYFNGIGHHMPRSHAEKMMDSVLKRWSDRDKAQPENPKP